MSCSSREYDITKDSEEYEIANVVEDELRTYGKAHGGSTGCRGTQVSNLISRLESPSLLQKTWWGGWALRPTPKNNRTVLGVGFGTVAAESWVHRAEL